ncbi:MAG: hypothetical protein M1445_12975 [Bacteroidetes bacterium]|nr:hypothetical protein [Bacteroidota bacterium]MCL6101564.1 hypothetical protein [Bacteroidota bacterium]
MKKLIMSGQAVVNYLGEHDEIIHGDCDTAVELYLEDQEFCQMSLTLDFPEAGILERAEFYIWYQYQDDGKITVFMDDAVVKLSEDELFIQFRLSEKIKRKYRRFRCVARLKGVFPPDILEGGGFFDLSGISVITRLPEQAIPSLTSELRMKGMIHLNYISTPPYKLYFNNGECELRTDDIGRHYLRFPYCFPEFQVNDIESTLITGTDFEGEGYYSLWFICVQLSEDELLIGFTIFDDRENYPHAIGGFARLRGEIPSTIQRKVLL